MFDDINKTSNPMTPPAYKPGQGGDAAPEKTGQNSVKLTEDIFADIDRGAKPAAFQPKNNLPPVNGKDYGGGSDSKKFFLLGVTVVCLILIFIGGYLGYKKLVKTEILNQSGNSTEENNAAQNQPIKETPVEPAVNNAEVASQTPATVNLTLDSDQDGLTDEEEGRLGTNKTDPDSDRDNLFDREEVKVYGTDPLKADTDNDGYLDGDEVKNGFNPKGPGRLYEINK